MATPASAATVEEAEPAAASTVTKDPQQAKKVEQSTESQQAVSKYEGTHTFLVNTCRFMVDAKYSPIKSLGTGAYGIVCSAFDRSKGNKRVAIKKIPNAFEDLIDAKRILREVKLLRHFKHPNVVGLKDMIPPPEGYPYNDIYMVMDLMETDLHKIIHSPNVLTDEHIQYFIYQTLRGLKYIHSAHVIHRDLKPSNLLLNSNCDLKICDLGLARGVSQEEDYELTEYVVTRWYRAPEVMCSIQQYDAKIDVWSVGCILAELHGRKPLFPGQDYIRQVNLMFSVLGTPSAEDMEFITNPKAKKHIESLTPCSPQPFSELYKKASPAAIDLMTKMLQFNPAKRISVDEALAHPYFDKLHNPKKEIECKEKFDFTFEREEMNDDSIRAFMWDECFEFRKELATRKDELINKERAARKKVRKNQGYAVSSASTPSGTTATPTTGATTPAP